MSILIWAAACIALVLAQIIFPQFSWYHQGSYAALLMALIAVQVWLLRRRPQHMLAVWGSLLIGIAGLASCLFAPDTQTYVAGPGQRIPLSEPAGVLEFSVSQPPGAPILHRGNKADVSIPLTGKRAYLASYILWTRPRTAAAIEAFDSRGAHLTLTQPQSTSASFLSPVLLFGETKTFQNQNLPVDSFALPAVRRNVNAVLFGAEAVSKMQKLASDPRPGILFAVSDEGGRILPQGLGFARSGEEIALAGVRLRPVIEDFPTVIIASAPYLPVIVLGLLLALAGVFRSRFR